MIRNFDFSCDIIVIINNSLQHEYGIGKEKSAGPLPHHRWLHQRQALTLPIFTHCSHHTHRLFLQSLLIKFGHQGRLSLLPTSHHSCSVIQLVHVPTHPGTGRQDEVPSYSRPVGCKRRGPAIRFAQVLKDSYPS